LQQCDAECEVLVTVSHEDNKQQLPLLSRAFSMTVSSTCRTLSGFSM
jgi:hypothetical protein